MTRIKIFQSFFRAFWASSIIHGLVLVGIYQLLDGPPTLPSTDTVLSVKLIDPKKPSPLLEEEGDHSSFQKGGTVAVETLFSSSSASSASPTIKKVEDKDQLEQGTHFPDPPESRSLKSGELARLRNQGQEGSSLRRASDFRAESHRFTDVSGVSNGRGPRLESPVQDAKLTPTPLPSNESMRAKDDFLREIREKIEKAKRYPWLARLRGLEGSIRISFRISSEGLVQDMVVTQSSNYRILDQAALETVTRAAPYPIIPSGLMTQTIQIDVPLVFKLQ